MGHGSRCINLSKVVRSIVRGAPAKGVEGDRRASASFGVLRVSSVESRKAQQRKSSSVSSLSRQPLAEVALQRRAMTARARA